MSDATQLLRSFVAYFDGLADMIPDKGQPTKAQWAKIQARVNVMRAAVDALPASNGSNGEHYSAPAAPKASVEEGQDPTPGGTKVNADWRVNVKKALVELGMDEESASEAMRDRRFRVDLNVMPGDYAARIEAGSY